MPLDENRQFLNVAMGMKIKRCLKVILLITLLGVLVWLWLFWPLLSFWVSLQKLNGDPSADGEWSFSMDTFADRVSSRDVADFYLEGSKHLGEISSMAESYTFGDLMGYRGCATVIQHAGHYEFVRVFGANDNDSITMGRSAGAFPPEWCSNLKKIPLNELPAGIVRPW